MRNIKLFKVVILSILLSNCGNKTDEAYVCFKKAANTSMINGDYANDNDLITMCSQFEGVLKDSDIEEKRKFKDFLDTIHNHIENKILFTDIEDVSFKNLPCGEELIKELGKKQNEKLKNYYLKNRKLECEIAVNKISKTPDGEFRVTGYFFNDEKVFDYGFNSFEIYVVLPKDESKNVLEAIKKEDYYSALKNNSKDNYKMLLNGSLAFKQILKFKAENVHRKTGYGLNFNFAIATEYEFIKPNVNTHKQQHFGYKDFIVDENMTQKTINTSITENKEKTPLENNILGVYRGGFGKDILIINIEKVENGNVIGYDEVKGNRRKLTGTIQGNTLVLNEPGDDKWDGVFDVTYSDNKLVGTWQSNNGKSTKKFTLEKQ